LKKNDFKINIKFAVALSFPGEYRDYVRQVSEALSEALEHEKVFFDECYEHIIAGIDGDTVLQRIYHDQSEMIVVFLCKEYKQKEWCCNVEWRAIRDLIKTSNRMNILLLKFDDVDIPGVYSIDIVPYINNRTPQDISQLILTRLQYIRDNYSISAPETKERLGELYNVPPLPNLEKYLKRTEVINTIKKAVLEPV